jgi:plastocyanin
LDTDGAFAMVFTKAGTYAYFCSIHPMMRGTIVVR